MVRVWGTKTPLVIFTLFLVVAVMGVSSFSANTVFYLFQDSGNLADSRGLLHSMSRNIDFLAESSAAINRNYRNSSFFMPSNIQNTETSFSASSLLAADEYYATIPKNSILVYLRI